MAFATETYTIQGMKQDTSELLADKNFAFENYNIRLLVDDTTTNLVATQEKGNTPVKIKITTNFFLTDEERNAITTFEDIQNNLPFVVIGQNTVDKYLVLFGKVLKKQHVGHILFEKGNDIILRLELVGDTFYGWLIYNNNELNFDVEWPLETLPNVETNLIKKVYFVDGINIPRSVNVVNKNAGQLANINLGFSLSLEDEFNVEKDFSVIGNYPMGKVRFFYTYFNDNFSETNIVDWSPYFDCNFGNQGGGPDSQYKTQFAFKITISNPDQQFKFVRVYMQHFTSPDPNVYTMKYIERPVVKTGDIVYTYTYDQEDAIPTTSTYLDKKLINQTFIPYTLAEKNNRMFYGNIKQTTPDLSNIDFSKCCSVIFYEKEIGYEDLTKDRVYQYEPNNTTFKGSNFDYMGFRKDNWYRFGFIAQYHTGEWSNVMWICDKQCNISSSTTIEYESTSPGSGTQINLPTSSHSGIASINKRPARSVYKIPSAKLFINNNNKFQQFLQDLTNFGYKRVKPVCVVPPAQYRNVITQGISCPTLYHGGGRNGNQINGLFAFPSHFFRPQPLYPSQTTIKDSDGNDVFKPNYGYTLRSLGDLQIPNNIINLGGSSSGNGGWLLNPKFDDERYANYNSYYREYRHGFSLPPKDRINAELQSSDFSIHDYYYKTSNQDSLIFSEANGFDLFGFFDGGINKYFGLYDGLNFITNATGGTIAASIIGYLSNRGVVPYHNVLTSGYNNTVFIDESICTLNSPEIDYLFSSQVEPFFKNQRIDVVGYAQVTNSQTNIDIPNTRFNPKSNAKIDEGIQNNIASGKCLFNLIEEQNVNLDDDLIEYVRNFRVRKGINNQPLSIINGPWWFDTMLVNKIVHSDTSNPTVKFWLNLADIITLGAISIGPLIAPASGVPGLLEASIAGCVWIWKVRNGDYDDHRLNFFNHDSGQNAPYGTLDNYTTNGTYGTAMGADNAVVFGRGIDQTLGTIEYKWTSSYYGETNLVITNKHDKEKWHVESQNSSVFHRVNKHNNISPAYIVDFPVDITDEVGQVFNNDSQHDNPTTYMRGLYRLSAYGFTWSTLYYENFSSPSDAFWNNYETFRTEHAGRIETLPRLASDNLNYIYSNWLNQDSTQYNLHNIDGDRRGTFSYYFFPYYKKVSNASQAAFYNSTYQNSNTDESDQVVTHPWLLPQRNVEDYYDNNLHIIPGNKYRDYEYNPQINYFDGSEYGCHYYAPFSTNFIGAVFDPYYAHVVYPFMSNDTNLPFCGSHDAYRLDNSRPVYNSTNSNLYSNCTNYVYPNTTFLSANHDTYSAYYHAPHITQEYRPEPDLSDIPFFKNANFTKIYSYLCNDSTGSDFTPLLFHRTYTLTAAMKWYRGFKRLGKDEGTYSTRWTCNGNYVNKSSIMGDLLFSGYLPQLFTKSGLNRRGGDPFANHIDILTGGKESNKLLGERYYNMNDFLSNDTVQSINIDALSTPHVVYYNHSHVQGELFLLDKFRANTSNYTEEFSISNFNKYNPEFYYKEFLSHKPALVYHKVNNRWYSDFEPRGERVSDSLPLTSYLVGEAFYPEHVKNTVNWYLTTYPHTGTWKQYTLSPLDIAPDSMPYWNRNKRLLKDYPETPTYKYRPINTSDSRIINYDRDGKQRSKDNYWLLPISNMYNMNLVTGYMTSSYGHNPYTYENISVEQWSWKICGETISLDNINSNDIKFLEGDTYFQRYNCFKTISKDTAHELLWSYSDADGTEQEFGVNDVTETASIMLESYTNLDGLYWEYNSTIDFKYSPLVHPFYNNMKQINPVYSIQNDLCDVFKQVDYAYDNSQLTHYPTKILWSAQKIDGETIDSWGIVPTTNHILISGEMGQINKFISYNNNIFSLQDHGLSVLNYDPQVVQPTDNSSLLSVYLSDATKLQGVTYISRIIGTINKWSVILGNNGFYWMDETLQKIYSYGQHDESIGIGDLTLQLGMQSWAYNHLSIKNGVWYPTMFEFPSQVSSHKSKEEAFKANVDLKSGDVYWMNNMRCLCYNENIKLFTSFYSYESTPYKFNYLDRVYSIGNTANSSDMYLDEETYDHKFYGYLRDTYIDLLVNPSGLYDKVFNFIEYNTESYKLENNKWVFNEKFNPYNHITASNIYQFAQMSMDRSNTKERFRLWRTDLPREGRMNRIRSPWCHVILKNITSNPHLSSGQLDSGCKDKLYYINVNFTIPEQPLKTNIQSSNQ